MRSVLFRLFGLLGNFRVFKSRLRLSIVLSMGVFILIRLLSLSGPMADMSFSRAVFDRHGSLLRMTLSRDEKYRRFVPLEQMSPAIIEAFLLREDRSFYYHPGINPLALARATAGFARGETPRGASTITMQLARLLYGLQTRSVPGKLRQILLALVLEVRFSKRQILEGYLNLVPLGHNIEGIPAAALIYYRKAPGELNPVEAISLAVIPPRPAARTRSSQEARHEVRAIRKQLFSLWVERHPEDRSLIVEAEHASLPEDRSPLPFAAPHFTDFVLSSSVESEIHTSLHLSMQLAIEGVLKEYIAERRTDGISNGAVLLIDSRTGQVIAQLGSANYHDPAIMGQVDGTRARRSPGSALKPMLYGLAADQGLIHSRTILKDAPVHFSTYSPENFEGEFLGPLPAESALVLSRNIPAIHLSARLKRPDLMDLLKKSGVSLPHSREYYGLAPIMGGVEVTMQELAAMYAALASGGRFRPVRFLATADGPLASLQERSLFSPQAAFLVMQMLRSGREESEEWMKSAVPVYWKTGTSSGFRDAWTVGIVGGYVLAVWIGNFDGSSNPAFVGRDAAAPLFFRILQSIRPLDGALYDIASPPPGVARIEVCAASGKMPHAFCPARVSAWYIPGISPIETCDVHREIAIDAGTGLRSCGRSTHTRKEVYEFWSSDIERLFRQAGIPRREAPPFGPECTGSDTDASSTVGTIMITLPVRGVKYQMEREQEEIGLRASASSSNTELYWFVDQEYVGSAPARDPVFWKARPGSFRVRVVDEAGAADQMDLRVAPPID